jgi:hypothetical protein
MTNENSKDELIHDDIEALTDTLHPELVKGLKRMTVRELQLLSRALDRVYGSGVHDGKMSFTDKVSSNGQERETEVA